MAAAVARLAFRAYANGRTYSQEEWVTEEVRALEVAVFTGADDYVLKGEGAESAAFEARGTKAQLPAEAVASACAAFRGEHRSELVLAAAKAAGPYGARFRAALGEEVVPWALNYADPVRERAGSRPSEVVGG
ncbi:MAG: hypothetical protein R3F62_27990 [Planctomycetota bacterium]